MPSIAYKTKICASSEDWSLALNIQHVLVVGLPSETVREMKSSIPKAVDVHLNSQLRVTITGLLNGDKITPPVLQDSCIARHLVEYLRLNANELGIAVSDLEISEATELLTFICTSSRPFQHGHDKNPFRTILVGLNLTYVWKTTPSLSDDHVRYPEIVASMNPFSCKQLSLPYLTAVNGVVKRFVVFQLVKRYPLIFGSWAQQLDVESPFTTSIHSSLSHIISRSPHSKFQALCKKLSKLAINQVASVSPSVTDSLLAYLGLEEPTDALESLSDDYDVSTVMTNFYHLGLKRPLFKDLSLSHITEDHEDHEDFFDDLSEENKSINCGADYFSERNQASRPKFENGFDLEDSDGSISSFECLHQYPDALLALPCDARTLLRDSDPEGGIMEPEYFSFLPTIDCLNEAENGNNFAEKVHTREPKTSKSDHEGHRLSNAYPCWSPDIDSSQEKLDHSSVGIAIAHTLPGPGSTGKSSMVLDPTCYVHCTELPDKKLPEIFNDPDFEDWSGSEQDDMFEFGSSTLQFDSDSGSNSTTSDGHEIIAFECMGSQRLAPLSPHSSILSEEPTSFGAIQMERAEDQGSCSGQAGFADTSANDNQFLVIDFA